MTGVLVVTLVWVVGVLVGSRWGVSLRRGVYRRGRRHSKKYSNPR